MKQTIIIFCLILFIGAFLRFWHLGGVPISPNWDEAALGYNAYSLLKTGKDEYGTAFPLVLKSFGNFTPATYAYLTIPAIALFDLSAFSVRLPSAILGTLAVIGAFFLSYQLFSLQSERKTRNSNLSLLVMFLFAISPWHIQFSRIAYEASIAFTLSLYGFLFFLLGIKRPFFFMLSAFLYGLSMHSYHSQRLFVPLFVIGLTLIFCKQLLKTKKQLIIPIFIGILFLIPFLFFTATGQTEQITGRFSQTSVFSKNTNEEITIFDAPIFAIPYEIAYGYLSHFSPNWLFITGDNDRHHAPSTGLLYLWEFPFLLVGIVLILFSKTRFRSIMILWILLAPIAASLTTEVPHAVRTLLILPSLQIATALGLEQAYLPIRRFSLFIRGAIIGAFFLIVLFFIMQYFHLYFFQMNHESSRFWQFGFEHAVNYVEQNKQNYKKIVISTKLEQPYIFFLFYTKYDPKKYLARGGTKNGTTQSFDIFEFRPITWNEEKHDGSTLYVLDPTQPRGETLHTIRYFDSSEAIIFSK